MGSHKSQCALPVDCGKNTDSINRVWRTSCQLGYYTKSVKRFIGRNYCYYILANN